MVALAHPPVFDGPLQAPRVIEITGWRWSILGLQLQSCHAHSNMLGSANPPDAHACRMCSGGVFIGTPVSGNHGEAHEFPQVKGMIGYFWSFVCGTNKSKP